MAKLGFCGALVAPGLIILLRRGTLKVGQWPEAKPGQGKEPCGDHATLGGKV